MHMRRHIRIAGLCSIVVVLSAAAVAQERNPQFHKQQFASGELGMVAAGTPYAATAGVEILGHGGNAIDAAAAAAFTLMVTDPANASLGGRTQILLRLSNGELIAIDGATQAPAGVKPLAKTDEERSSYAVVPVPGNPAALAQMVAKYGRLPLSRDLAPAIRYAENGFRVTPRLASTWARVRADLAKNPGTALNFLKKNGAAYKTGEVFRQPRLAALLREIARSGPSGFYQGNTATAIARDSVRGGGYITADDLASYRALNGVVVHGRYRGYQFAAAGGRAWGDTLAEMLNILDHFPIGRGPQTADELDIVARAMAQALEDRPQEIGTLKPKLNFPRYPLSSTEFATQRAELIRGQLVKAGAAAPTEPHDTTHLSVMDAEGNAVALTTSIGPSFGSRVATPELGFIYAHSYRMRADPTPNARDETEMCPTILFRQHTELVLGSAGSERIPTSIVQVLSNVIDRGEALDRAMAEPRIYSFGNRIDADRRFDAAMLQVLRERGYQIETRDPGTPFHFGLVNAVQYDPARRKFFGAADPVSDGMAAAPTHSSAH